MLSRLVQQPFKVVVLKVPLVLVTHECGGRGSPLGQSVNGKHPSKSPEEENLGVTGRMTAPPPSEATILQEEDLT